MVVEDEGSSSSSSLSLMTSLSSPPTPSNTTSDPCSSSNIITVTASSSSPNFPPWLRDLKSDERGLYLIHLLLNCANHVAASNLDHANAFLDHISLLASPDGDAMQRIASYFTQALARRILRSWPGLYRALTSAAPPFAFSETLQARKHFLDICPFIGLSFLLSNQAILEAMDGEKMVHIVDLDASDPSHWLALIKALNSRPDGPPHLRITGVNQHKELLNHTAAVLTEEAEKLDIPFQFHPVVARLDALDLDTLRVKTGEALAISSLLQLHSLLACEDNLISPSPYRKIAKMNQVQVQVQAGQQGTTLGELIDNKEYHHHQINGGYVPPPDSASSAAKIDNLLASLWGLSPKVMVVIEQESNHNGRTLNERFMEALNFYAALFDCLESTVSRQSVERLRVEKMLFGEEINNIIACEGLERKERHDKFERWVQRLEMAGFGRMPLSYFAMLQARRSLMSYGCEGYQVKEENGCFFICWQDRPLFSVSAWRCRRYD